MARSLSRELTASSRQTQPSRVAKSVFQALSGNWAITWIGIVLVTTSWAILVGFYRYVVPLGFGELLTLLAVGVGVPTAVLLAARPVQRRLRDPALRASIVLAVFYVVGVLRTAIAVWGFGADPGTESLGSQLSEVAATIWILNLGAVSAGFWLISGALVGDRFYSQLDRVAQLQEATAVLAADRSERQRMLDQELRSLTMAVNSDVVPRLRAVATELSGPDGESAEALAANADRLSEIAQRLIRPLSHELLAEADVHVPVAAVPVQTSWTLDSRKNRERVVGGLVNETARQGSPPIVMTAAVLAAGVVPASLAFDLRAGVVFLVMLAGFVGAGVFLANKLSTAIADSMSASIRVTGTVVALTAIGALGYLAGTTVARVPSDAIAACAIGVLVACLGQIVAAIFALDRMLRETIAARRSTVAVIEWEKTAIDRELVLARRRLGALLHGEVQNTLTVASLLLAGEAKAVRGGRHCRSSVIERVRSVVLDAEQALSNPWSETVGELVDLLERVRANWEGIVDIDVSVSDQATVALNASRLLSVAVLDVISEAVGNAARHGHASVVRITVDASVGRCWIVAADNGSGTGPDASIVPGAGLTRMTQENIRWWFEPNAPRGTKFIAIFPVAGAVDSSPGQSDA